MPLATPFTNEVPCARCPLRECEVFRSLSDDEVEFVQSLNVLAEVAKFDLDAPRKRPLL